MGTHVQRGCFSMRARHIVRPSGLAHMVLCRGGLVNMVPAPKADYIPLAQAPSAHTQTAIREAREGQAGRGGGVMEYGVTAAVYWRTSGTVVGCCGSRVVLLATLLGYVCVCARTCGCGALTGAGLGSGHQKRPNQTSTYGMAAVSGPGIAGRIGPLHARVCNECWLSCVGVLICER